METEWRGHQNFGKKDRTPNGLCHTLLHVLSKSQLMSRPSFVPTMTPVDGGILDYDGIYGYNRWRSPGATTVIQLRKEASMMSQIKTNRGEYETLRVPGGNQKGIGGPKDRVERTRR